MEVFITGARRGLGLALQEIYGNSSLEECDLFINCKHDGFSQVDLLYKAAELGIDRIINIGSNSPDKTKYQPHIYQVQKAALDLANNQLFYQGVNTTIVRFGYFDSPRVAHVTENKMSIEYCCNVIKWVIEQPHRVKDITLCPD